MKSPLSFAIKKRQCDAVEFLIELGARVSKEDNKLLLDLSRSGDLKSMEILINAGADIDVRDEWKQTPLIIASKCNQSEIVEFLIKAGANLNAVDDQNDTAFSWACYFNDYRAMESLVRAEADLTIVNKAGLSAIEVIIFNRKFDLLEFIFSLNPKYSDFIKVSQILRILSESKTKLSKKDIKVVSYIIKTVFQKQDRELVNILVSFSKINHCIFIKLISMAILFKENSLVKSISEKRKFQLNSALIISGEYGNLEMIKFFIDKYASIDSINDRKETALIKAAENGHLDSVKFLVKSGANLDLQNQNGETAFDCARRKKHYAVTRFLIGSMIVKE